MTLCRKTLAPLLPLLILILCFMPDSTSACSVCFGAPDSQVAKGASWSVVALLGIVMIVLTGIAGFFVFLAKRSREAGPLPVPQTEAYNQ